MKELLLSTIKMLTKYFLYCFLGVTLTFSTLSASVGNAQVKSVRESVVTLRKGDYNMVGLINTIQQQTNFEFVYASDLAKKQNKIPLDNGQYTVEEVLLAVAKETDYEFKQVNKSISIKKARDQENSSPVTIVLGADAVVSGVVTGSNGETLPGATIIEKGTSNGTVSDLDGRYTIDVTDENATLVISFIGYVSREVAVGGRSTIDIEMTEDGQQLAEVVVVGYGTQKKSHLTGAVTKVTNTNLDQMPVNNIDQALAGKLSGVQVSNTDAEAGASQTIQVRGISSINAGTGPLIVVDGYPIPTSDMSVVDQNDVQSIEVLKDAASTAIYGSRGSNGVILITTKSGSAGKVKFSFKGQTGVRSLYSYRKIYSTPTEWADYVNSNLDVMGLSETPDQITEMMALGTATDWQDEVTRDGIVQNYSLSATGGTENVKYFISGSYLSDEGVFLKNDYSKFSLRANLDIVANDWLEFGIKINPTYVKQTDVALRFHDALRGAAWLPIYHTSETVGHAHASGYPDIQPGDYAHELHFSNVNGVNLGNSGNTNSIAAIRETDISRNFLNTYANGYVKFKFSKDFNFKSSIGTFSRVYEREYFRKSGAHRDGDIIGQYQNQRMLNFLNENILNFKKSIGDHNIDALAGFSIQKWYSSTIGLNSDGYLLDQIPTMNAAANVTVIKSGTQDTEESLLSSLFRVNYDYQDKYLLSVTTRWDASSRFGENNKWGFFPSASVGWRLSEEGFLSNSDKISNLKLRASFGVTGNNGISNYEAIPTLSPADAIIGGQPAQGLIRSTPGNPDISWERTFELNTGFDMGLFKDRLNFSFNYYRAKTEQLLLLKEIPNVTGFSQVRVNQGKLQNTGMELEVGTVNINSGGFTWRTNFNISGNRNEVLDFGGVDEIISTPDIKRPSQFITRPGDPLVQFYGYVVKEEIPLDKLATPYWPIGVGHEQIYVRDLNGDGVIDTDDRTILGNPYPDFIWGMTNTFTYKNFDLSFVFQGSQGAEVYNIDEYYFGTYWKGQNTLDDSEQAKTKGKLETSRNVQDASFIALRNLNIGYKIPAKFMQMRVYASVQNLWYKSADDYISFNPEGVNEFTDNPLTYGYQRGATPFARTFSLGVSATF